MLVWWKRLESFSYLTPAKEIPIMLTAAATCSTWRCLCFRWAFFWFCFLIGRQYITTLKNLCLPLIITFCFQILVYALIYIAVIGVHLQVCILLYGYDITSQTLSLLYFSHKYFSGCITFCHNLLNLFLFLDTKVASTRPISMLPRRDSLRM